MSDVRFICKESEFTEDLMNWVYINYKSDVNRLDCNCYILPINEWKKINEYYSYDKKEKYEIMDGYENLITFIIDTTRDDYTYFCFMRMGKIIIQWIESRKNIFTNRNIFQSTLLLLSINPDMLLIYIRLYEDNLRLLKDNEKLNEEMDIMKHYSPGGEGYNEAKLHFEYLSANRDH